MLSLFCDKCGAALELAPQKDERDRGALVAVAYHGSLPPSALTSADELEAELESSRPTGYHVELRAKPCEACTDEAFDNGYESGQDAASDSTDEAYDRGFSDGLAEAQGDDE